MFIAANFDNFSIEVMNTCHCLDVLRGYIFHRGYEHVSLFGCIKGLYPPNFENILKSMTCVHIESIHFDGFKNVKKKSK